MLMFVGLQRLALRAGESIDKVRRSVLSAPAHTPGNYGVRFLST
jgi:hypothetical protein